MSQNQSPSHDSPRSATSREEALLRRLAAGDKDAFAELIDLRGRELFRFFRLLGADPHEADDCVQETFLRLFAYRQRIRPSSVQGFRVLFYRIARNVRADALRRKLKGPQCVSVEHVLEVVAPDGASQLFAEWSLDLDWALAALPEKLRAVVVLNVFQGLPYREVAMALGIPEGTVKSRMSLAVQRLREVLRVESPR